MAARSVEPRHADPVAFLHIGDTLADGRDVSHALVTGDERRLRLDRPVPLGGVQVGMAHARRLDRDLYHARFDLGNGHLVDRERGAEFSNHGGFHRSCH